MGPKGLIKLCDPPTKFTGFIDGARVWIDGKPYIFHKGQGSAFDTVEPISKEMIHDPGSKSG